MGNNGFGVGRLPLSARSMQRFRLGTCLTTTAAALLVGLAPASAGAPRLTLGGMVLSAPQDPMAATRTAVPVDLTVRRDPSSVLPPARRSPIGVVVSGAAPDRRNVAPAPLRDLTMIPVVHEDALISGGDVSVQTGAVVTTGDGEHGVETEATGTTRIATGDISTSGSGAAGVHAIGYGDMTIGTGNAATSGYRADGIYANNNVGGASGGISIAASSVATVGEASSGIDAASYHGAVAIDVGAVKTSGFGADGINAWSGENDVTIKAGTISTTGESARGIIAYSGGTTTVVADTVTTSGPGTGQDSDAAAIRAVGAGVSVQAGFVSTKGAYSAGIYAVSNAVHDNGQEFRDISVAAGSVSTSGNQSDAIDAINYSMSKTSVAAGHVDTSGDASWGIYAAGLGDVSVKVGTVGTTGAQAAGIAVTSISGNIDVSADAVTTVGDHSNAINAINLGHYGTTTISAGTISTNGAGSTGIYSSGSKGEQAANHVVTVDAGSIFTNGDLAAGLVIATSGTVDVNVGDVVTLGARSRGILVTNSNGDIDLTAGNVSTSGGVAYGRDSSAVILNTNFGHLNASIQSVATAGDHSTGVNVSGTYSNQSLVVRDGVTTTGNYSAGIYGAVQEGVLSIDSGSVATAGAVSVGVTAQVLDADVGISVGKLTTLGDYSTGLDVRSGSYGGAHLVSLGFGSIDTKGGNAVGVLVTSQGGNIEIGGGSVTTSGLASAGIAAAAGNGVDADGNVYGGNVSIEVGTVTTSGDRANGIDTVATQSTDIRALGVTTSGAGASGIHAYGNGPITIEAGSVSTTGDHSYGIYALTAAGDVSVKAGAVNTGGFLAHGINAASYNGNVTVDVGAVATGVGTGIDVRAGYGDHGNANVTVGTIVSDGAGIVALAGDDVTINAGDITTHSGTEDAGTQLGQAIRAVGHGNIDITAGAITTTGYWAEGVDVIASPSSAGQEPGSIKIDVGTVSTDGVRSAGIRAIDTGYQNGGTQIVDIKAGPVSTSGGYASGIYGVGPNVTITANGPVSTAGVASTGIYAAAIGGTASVSAGDVSTNGDFASGVRAFSSYGSVDVTTSGAISTEGAKSYGVLAFGSADLTIHNSGSVTTAGTFARGLYAISSTGLATITNGAAIKTSGEYAEGIRAISLADGVHVTSTGSITTTGDSSAGIIAGRDRSGRGDKMPEMGAAAVPTVTVSADAILTTGARSNGVIAVNYAVGGSTAIDVKNVTTTGLNSVGIASITFGDLAVTARDIHSSGIAVYARTVGAYSQGITVTGSAISTDNTAIVASATFGDSTINIAKGARVIGGGHVTSDYSGAGDGILIDLYAGNGTINNAGTLSTAGDGHAIEATSGIDYYGNPTGHVLVNNTGSISGALKLGLGADVVNNAGVFVATKDSDFGGGGDAFNNSGTVVVAPGAKAGTIAFNNLATFRNSGGLIDFRDGVAGDVLRISGNFVGSGSSSLAIDLIGGKADRLEVAGAATGHTGIALTVAAQDTRLLSTPVTLVKAGAGSAPDAFSITNADLGLLHYGVRYDSAAGTFGLSAAAGAPVYRMLNIPRATQANWLRAEDAWDAHMSEKRDAHASGEGFGQRVWGQLYGGVTSQDGSRVLDGSRFGTGYRQDYYGGQVGFDLLGKATERGGVLFGVTGSYLSSHLNGRDGGDRSQFDTVEVGAYASFLAGPFFANALGQYGHDWIGTRTTALGYKDRLRGDSYGATFEVGARLGTDRFYGEPTVSLSYVATDVSDLRALGQTIDFDKRNGLRGKFGGRIGSALDLKGGNTAVIYLRGNYVHEFDGKAGADLLSGGSVDHVSGISPSDYGTGALGVNFVTAGRVSGFIEGNTDFGGGVSGGGGRVGITFKL